MSELPQRLKFLPIGGQADGQTRGVDVQRVGIVDGAIGGEERFASLAALFPKVAFVSAGPVWPERPPVCDVLIAPVDALSAADVDGAVRRLKARPNAVQIVVVLRNADVMTTRRLIHEGAADVLTAPVAEPALALSLERLFGAATAASDGARRTGEVVAFLKAGGGVGASMLVTQLGAMLAQHGHAKVAIADLDLQFGAAAVYLDMPDAISIADCLTAGDLDETPFASALARHASGVQVLAAPRELTPLEMIAPQHVDALVAGMRRDFALTLVDLPAVWTAWTHRVLQLADRIVLVTHLSVPHVNFVKRQMRVLASQGLESVPMTLVCNALSAEQQGSLSVKAAERALGRTFDAVLPEDSRTVLTAMNQGVTLSSVRRGTKLEKAIHELAPRIMAGAAVPAGARGWR